MECIGFSVTLVAQPEHFLGWSKISAPLVVSCERGIAVVDSRPAQRVCQWRYRRLTTAVLVEKFESLDYKIKKKKNASDSEFCDRSR